MYSQKKLSQIQTKVNEEGNPNNRFGYAATKDKESYVSTKVETFVKPEAKLKIHPKQFQLVMVAMGTIVFGSSFAKG